ncbi:MAG: NADH-quinone oxidoreductase subunit D [Methanomicrobiales archaeon]|jgi:Ni,Fe-hydrogenase III large subunit|nr:NADH-quinone oxidoreductase subunit D [Methanomicrobiales archaeon]
MSNRIVVPFGPQHPVLPEPIHLDLVLEDERVVEAIPTIGYIHRGLEKLVEKRDFKDYVLIAERICGICSFTHSVTYCNAIEQIMGIEVPPRAQFIRTIWMEYSRMHSHLLWLGLTADAMGFENLFMNAWRLREEILDDMEATTGGRVIQGSSKVGGIRLDIPDEKLGEMVDHLKAIRPRLEESNRIFTHDQTVRHRMRGLGVLTKEEAWDLGAVGPVARGSGCDMDVRSSGYSAYGELGFKPITLPHGDCLDRCLVRSQEVLAAVDLVERAVAKMPDGPIEEKVKGNPDGECFAFTEQPRGECMHYVKANGTKNLVRHRVRTPTLTNIPPLVKMLAGIELADVPVVVLTIDPCIGCAER